MLCMLNKQTARVLILLVIAVGASACTGAQMRAPVAQPTDATAIAAQAIIDNALRATATLAPKLLDMASAPTVSTAPTSSTAPVLTTTPDHVATATAQAHAIETVIAATLTAQPTPTPNLAATQTAQSALLETAVAATLTAQPRPTATHRTTPTPDYVATADAEDARVATSVALTLEAQRPLIPQPRAGNFRACLESCASNGANARWWFPEAVTKIYVAYDYTDIPAGAHYQRIWRVAGRGEWARYDCTWSGPAGGAVEVTLTEPNGLYSGEWELSIVVEGAVILQESFVVEGTWRAWYPAGVIPTCFGKVSTR